MLGADKNIIIEKLSEVQERWFNEAKNGQLPWLETYGAMKALHEVIKWVALQPTEDETDGVPKEERP